MAWENLWQLQPKSLHFNYNYPGKQHVHVSTLKQKVHQDNFIYNQECNSLSGATFIQEQRTEHEAGDVNVNIRKRTFKSLTQTHNHFLGY